MASDKQKAQVRWLPFLILGYLETLRRATFYAFGWNGYGQALTIVSVLVVAYVFTDYFWPSKLRKIIIGALSLIYFAMVWLVNKSYGSGEYLFISEVTFGLPDFGVGTISPFYYATLSLSVVVFYALLVFLMASFILEKKSFSEMFFASVLLLGVEIITSDQGIIKYVVLNTIFSMGLRSQVYFLELENDDRVRFTGGAGLNTDRWVGVSVVLAVVIALISVVIPGKAKVDISTIGSRFNQQMADTKRAGDNGGSFELFWGKLQNFELKGEVPSIEAPVMYVRSARPAYWRGESSDYYTGSGWNNSLRSRLLAKPELTNPFSVNVEIDKVDQMFILGPGTSSQVVFSLGAPASLEIPDAEILTDDGGNIYTSEVKHGITYRVVSYYPEINREKLRHTSMEYPVSVRRLYLQLPDSIPRRVHELSRKLTQNVHNPYDKVKLIKNYLSSNYPYDLTISPAPQNHDVVDYFLFDLKRGYCTYHSTAMVVMLRSIGIPARWVKGFTTGVFDSDTGVYQVNMSDAHSWVEVYFSNYGWIPVDPTPSFVIPGSLDDSESLSSGDVLDSASTVSQQVSPNEILAKKDPTSWKGIVILLLSGSIMLGLYLRKKESVLSLRSGDKLRDIYLSFIELLAANGYAKTGAQTPLEFARGMAEELPDDYTDIMYITNAYLNHKYGKVKLDKEEIDNVTAVWKRLKDKWTGKSRH